MNGEKSRLEEARTNKAPWKKWGPYLSERQWGTVREDARKTLANGKEKAMTEVRRPARKTRKT